MLSVLNLRTSSELVVVSPMHGWNFRSRAGCVGRKRSKRRRPRLLRIGTASLSAVDRGLSQFFCGTISIIRRFQMLSFSFHVFSRVSSLSRVAQNVFFTKSRSASAPPLLRGCRGFGSAACFSSRHLCIASSIYMYLHFKPWSINHRVLALVLIPEVAPTAIQTNCSSCAWK